MPNPESRQWQLHSKLETMPARIHAAFFTIGPTCLNPEGTPADQNGACVSHFRQLTFRHWRVRLRAWTGMPRLPPRQTCAQYPPPRNGGMPMVPRADAYHDMAAKTILGPADTECWAVDSAGPVKARWVIPSSCNESATLRSRAAMIQHRVYENPSQLM